MTVKKVTCVKQVAQVRFHKSGILSVAPLLYQVGQQKLHARGKVVGWSPKSRRRLRRFMLEHDPLESCLEANITLTIPGPPPAVSESKKLWLSFCKYAQRKGVGFVWRVEFQQRGSPHWHIIAHYPCKQQWQAVNGVYFELKNLWLNCIKSLGPCEGEYDGGCIEVGDRASWPGADRYAYHVKVEEGAQGRERYAWRRYMQDHASKGKYKQIAIGFGRHWGVVNRALYVKRAPDHVQSMTDRQFYAFLRMAQRLTSGTVREPKAPFGRKRAKRLQRGKAGKSVWFSDSETMRKLVDCARSNKREEGQLA